MRLSFKKSILLFTTVALGSMLGASAQNSTHESVLVEGYTFEREWKSEDVPKWSDFEPWSYCRQGFGQNNQFFIQNNDEEEIQIYGQNGKIGTFATSTGLGSNFTRDEAGNMIVCVTEYPNDYDTEDEFLLIKADGSVRNIVNFPEDVEERGDYWGFAEGDIFSAEGGKLMLCATNIDYMYLLVFKNGQLTDSHHIERTFLFNDDPYLDFDYDDVVNFWTDAKGKKHYLLFHSSERPVDMILDEDTWTIQHTVIDTWAYNRYGTSKGTNAFAFNGKNYIMFSERPNWNDGFAIAELGTNEDGTLDGTVNVVARHINDYTTVGEGNSSQCNWLNWEPRDSKSVYIYQYFPGFCMARYIFGIETEDTPLVDIVNDGTVGETYTVADDILGVYIAQKDPTRVYAKDYNNHRHPSTIKEGEVDFVKDQVDENGTNLQQDEWDQSNWVILDFKTAEEAQNFAGKIGEANQTSPIACKVIKGGTLTGKLTNKLNPTMTVTSYVEPTETDNYLQNSYIPCNFMTPNVQSNIFWHGETHDYFFIEPKPQEYVKVWWALYDKVDHFTIDTDSKFKGSFNADRSLYPGVWEQDFKIGKAYNFHAIVRYVDANGSMTGSKADGENNVGEGRYMVFPLEGGAGIITGISNISSDAQVAGVTYVNMLGYESTTPFKGINLVVTHYTNGTTRVSKELR